MMIPVFGEDIRGVEDNKYLLSRRAWRGWEEGPEEKSLWFTARIKVKKKKKSREESVQKRVQRSDWRTSVNDQTLLVSLLSFYYKTRQDKRERKRERAIWLKKKKNNRNDFAGTGLQNPSSRCHLCLKGKTRQRSRNRDCLTAQEEERIEGTGITRSGRRSCIFLSCQRSPQSFVLIWFGFLSCDCLVMMM